MPYTLFRYAVNIATAHVTLLSDDDEALDESVDVDTLSEKEGVHNTHYIDTGEEKSA